MNFNLENKLQKIDIDDNQTNKMNVNKEEYVTSNLEGNEQRYHHVQIIDEDVENLSFVIANVISNLDEYKSKYSASKKYVLEHLTYKHYIDYF